MCRYTIFQYLLLFLVLLLVILVRFRLLDVPLERDEGEYAYMAQLLLKGIPPYVNAYTMKLPGVSIVYALFMFFFGQTPFGIHLGLLIINSFSAGLVWLLARRLFDENTATTSAIIFLMLSLSRGVLGCFAHATHFVNLFSLAGFILLLHYFANRRMFIIITSGVCFGLAITMKQHAVMIVIFAFIYLIRIIIKQGTSWKKLLLEYGLFLFSTAAPILAIVLWLSVAGGLGQFWLWTIEYSRDYVSGNTFANGLSNFIIENASIIYFQLPIWVFSYAGVVFLAKSRNHDIDRLFMFGFLFSALLAMCPGFYFTNHYFILILPSISLFAGFAIRESKNLMPASASPLLQNSVPIAILVALISYGLYKERLYLFFLTPVEVNRTTYNIRNPFTESVEIARYLKARTSPNDRIAILGSEPQIYFYSNRLSASGHIYMYGLTGNNLNAEKMQIEMVKEIEATQPLFIVKVSIWQSWPNSSKSPQYLTIWANEYIVGSSHKPVQSSWHG